MIEPARKLAGFFNSAINEFMMGQNGFDRTILTILLFFALYQHLSAQISVTPDQTAIALAQNLAGKGVTISNCTLTCPSQANGIFHVIGSIPGIDSGILLTTGRAATSGINYGVNGFSISLASNDNGAPGDAMLDPLAGQHTLDACSLEFDVLPVGDTIRFSYVFSSEEYINAVCGPYNDAFAFFISGPGISGSENMALVPGTDIPVTINSINNGIPGITGTLRNCTMMGAGSPFTSYYIDNATGTTLTHKGLTKVLNAIHTVIPCNSYHLKLVIADAGDPLYDSGVFLKAGSLQTNSFSVSSLLPPVSDATTPYCIKGCLPGIFRVKRQQAGNQPVTLKYFTGGSAISGLDFSPLPDSVTILANNPSADVMVSGLPTPANGTKSIAFYLLSPYNCSSVGNIADSASILIYDTLSIQSGISDTTICGNLPLRLVVNGPDLLSYSWTPANGLDSPGIKDPLAEPASSTTYNVLATLPGTSCSTGPVSTKIIIKLTPSIQLTSDTTVCYRDGLILKESLSALNEFYSYYWTGPDSFVSNISNPVLENVTAKQSGKYNLVVTIDTNGCKDNAALSVYVNIPDTPQFATPQIFCLNSTPESISIKGDSLKWYNALDSMTSNITPVPSTSSIATYSYFVTQTINNCESPEAHITAEIKKCCDGNIFIPTAFTPNNDGRNDHFEVLEDYGYFIKSMLIFNRWGQLIYSGDAHSSWDGNFLGAHAETGTYFYSIKFGCILGGSFERKGDITLIR